MRKLWRAFVRALIRYGLARDPQALAAANAAYIKSEQRAYSCGDWPTP